MCTPRLLARPVPDRMTMPLMSGGTARFSAMRHAAVVTDWSDRAVGMLRDARELPPWLVPAYVRRCAAEDGASDVGILLQDYDQRMLVPLTDESAAEAAT